MIDSHLEEPCPVPAFCRILQAAHLSFSLILHLAQVPIQMRNASKTRNNINEKNNLKIPLFEEKYERI